MKRLGFLAVGAHALCEHAVSSMEGVKNSECVDMCEDGDMEVFYSKCTIEEVSEDAHIDGFCFDNYVYGGMPEMDGWPDDVSWGFGKAVYDALSVGDCQEACQQDSSCYRFTFFIQENATFDLCFLSTKEQVYAALNNEKCGFDVSECEDCLECHGEDVCVSVVGNVVGGPKYCDQLPNHCDPEDTCTFPLDMMILQDLSWSFGDDLAPLKEGMRPFLWTVDRLFPDARYAIASFVDKPVEPLGWSSDTCWNTRHLFTDDLTSIFAEVDRYNYGSGYDWPENQLEVLFHSARGSQIPWTDTEDAVRVALLFTDSIYHIAGHGQPLGLKPNNHDDDLDCAGEDYPLIEQIAKAMEANGVYPVFLVSNDERVPSVDNLEVYQELLHYMDVPGHVALIPKDYKNAYAGLARGLAHLAPQMCVPPTKEPTQGPDDVEVYEIDFLIDLSHSFTNDLPFTKDDMKFFFEEIVHDFPGTKVGLGSFTDKPVDVFGWAVSGDYCYYRHCPLTSKKDELFPEIEDLFLRSGRDMPEAQLHALFQTTLDDSVGWSAGGYERMEDGLFKIAILITDGPFHRAGDGVAAGLEANNHDEKLDCTGEDYPEIEAIAKRLSDKGILPVFAALDAELVPLYEDLMDELESHIAGISSGNMPVGVVVDASKGLHTVMDQILASVGKEVPVSEIENKPKRLLSMNENLFFGEQPIV